VKLDTKKWERLTDKIGDRGGGTNGRVKTKKKDGGVGACPRKSKEKTNGVPAKEQKWGRAKLLKSNRG